MPDLPESPPAAPVIPVGLGTRLGVLSSAVFAVVTVLTTLLDGDHSPETIALLLSTVLTLATTIGGRMAQAAAALRAAGPTATSYVDAANRQL